MAWHPFRNLGLKALALAIATLMWLTVTRDQLVERNLRVPLEYRNIPETLEIMGDSPASVDVRLRGASSILGRLEPGDVVAVLDLRGARPGQRLFHLITDEVRVPFGVEVSQISPPTVSLTFERSASRIVPVVPAIDGEPAEGYVIGHTTVDPASVEVVGPESRLGELKGASTEPVSVEGATSSVRDTVTIGVTDASLRLEEARTAKVTVEILPAPVERAVYDVPVRVRGLPPARRASAVPPRVTLFLRGSRQALGTLDVSKLQAWVDGGGLGPGRHALEVQADIGPDLTLVRAEPGTVEVQVR